MYVIVPHVGKSHLTLQCLESIPDRHHPILVDASYVADLDVYAENHARRMTYVRPERVPQCLAANWNLGAEHVPEAEHVWLFAASDVQFYRESWVRLRDLLRCFPDAGIIRDHATNWNVFAMRRWAWNLLRPMDERYQPCGGEDDDLVMKCHHSGIRIKSGWIGVNHLEGGHATRLDIRRELAGTTWDGRHRNIAVFQRKWGCVPSLRSDPKYQAAHAEVHIEGRRKEPPAEWSGHSIPRSRKPWPEKTWPLPLQIHIGCGRKPAKDRVNTDVDPRAKADVIFDAARDEWPFEDDSAVLVEAYHVLEHMSREEGRTFLAKAHRALKTGGQITLECPDLGAVCAKFPGSQRRMSWSLYGDQSTPWRFHRWGYSRETIRLALERAGFRGVEVGDGTDYHAASEPCWRAEAKK